MRRSGLCFQYHHILVRAASGARGQSDQRKLHHCHDWRVTALLGWVCYLKIEFQLPFSTFKADFNSLFRSFHQRSEDVHWLGVGRVHSGLYIFFLPFIT